MQLNEQTLISSYAFFAKRLFQDRYLVESKSESVAITFLSLLKKRHHLSSLREEWLWQYLVFQFDFWQTLSLSAFDKRMKFSFIYGKKAFLRYESRNQDFDWRIQSCDVSCTLSKKQFVDELCVFEKAASHNAENIHRQMFLNKDEGLSNCLLLTTLFDPLNKYCQQCIFQKECKELLRMNYPKFYKNRNIK